MQWRNYPKQKPTKKKKPKYSSGKKKKQLNNKQKKNSKNKNSDLRSKISNPKKKNTHYLRNIIKEPITSKTQSLKSYRSMKKNDYLKVNTTVEQTAEVVIDEGSLQRPR